MAEQPPASDGKQPPSSDGKQACSFRQRPSGPPLRKQVVIIGAGIGGLTAARALLDAGCEVRRAQCGCPTRPSHPAA